MCSEGQYIATTIAQIIVELPPSEDCVFFQLLYRKCGYTAPEICGELWVKLFQKVSQYNDYKIEWHVKLYNIYHNRLAQYKRLYVKN